MSAADKSTRCSVALVVALITVQLPGDSWYEVGLEHLYSYEYEEAIATFERGIQEHPENPMLYLRLSQATLLRDKRDLENLRFRQNNNGLIFSINGKGPWQERHQNFKRLIQEGARVARNQTIGDYQHYLLGALAITEAGYLYQFFGERNESLSQISESLRELKPLLNDETSPFHDAALFYYSLLSAQTGKNIPRIIGHTILPLYGIPYHLDRGLRDLRATAERTHTETTGAQLTFVEIMSTIDNEKNTKRHKGAALRIAQTLINRYPKNPSIRYHAILLYRKNGRNADAKQLRDETLRLLRDDSRVQLGLLDELLEKIKQL